MNRIPKIERTLLIRLGVSLVLAAAALSLFLMSRSAISTIERSKQALSPSLVASIDREIDSILSQFKIEKGWMRKNSFPIPNTIVYRIERRIAIPPSVQAVQMNVAMNAMAKRHNGRAVASENLKENSVTIHIEMQGYIVQTIILKTNPDLKRGGKKVAQTKA